MGDQGKNSPVGGSQRPSTTDGLPQDLVDAMQALFGKHPGFRTTHAKGLLVEGHFAPTDKAKTLSIASHFNNESTPVIARFSVGGGIPRIPDTNDAATPKGIAIRFQIDDDTYTDLIAHTFNGFATSNGEDFLTFLKLFGAQKSSEALLQKVKAAGQDSSIEQTALDKANDAFGKFLKTHPAAAKFALGEKPNPHNYGTVTYWEPNTHVLTNSEGKVTNVRYRLDPADGDHLYPNSTPADKAALARMPPSYLEDDLRARFPDSPIVFTIQAHIASPEDVLDDATVEYKSTEWVEVGKLVINKVSDDNDAKQQQIAFSPSPEKGGVHGITSSNDPLIQARKGVYWISADQRRNQKRTE